MENEGYDSTGEQNEKPAVMDNNSVHGKESTKLDMSLKEEEPLPMKPYAGMGKEDLLRLSDTPFWNRLRLISLIVFWVGWIALLVAVVVMTIVSPRCDETPTQQWWEKTTFYQIYIRSFYDGDRGDGVGDLKGILQKLDYIESLNVEAIILSSFFESEHNPNNNPDYGYEVINHTAIEPDYGTLEDFGELVTAVHDKGMKILIDFIPNHTGIRHQWFIDWLAGAGTSTDFYTNIECGDANNWLTIYGETAWVNDGEGNNRCYFTQQLYSQPELNLRSEVVLEELDNVLKFWLDQGVDGFRVNSARYLVEDFDLRPEGEDNPCTAPNPYDCLDHSMTANQPDNMHLLSRWRDIVDNYNLGDGQIRVLLADVKETTVNTLLYYGIGPEVGANLPMNFGIVEAFASGCNGDCLYDLVYSWMESKRNDTVLDWMTSHQDESRIATVPTLSANAYNILRMTLPGSSFSYYGEEIGMVDGDTTDWTCFDPAFNNGSKIPCRDRSRTVMQWDDSDNGGFSGNDSWIPVNEDFATVNVAVLDDSEDEFSTLTQFRLLADLQRTSTAMNYGNLHFAFHDADIFSFVREYDGTDRYLVTVNVGSSDATSNYQDSNDIIPGSAEVVVVSSDDHDFVAGDSVGLSDLTIKAGQGAVLVWPYSR